MLYGDQLLCVIRCENKTSKQSAVKRGLNVSDLEKINFSAFHMVCWSNRWLFPFPNTIEARGLLPARWRCWHEVPRSCRQMAALLARDCDTLAEWPSGGRRGWVYISKVFIKRADLLIDPTDCLYFVLIQWQCVENINLASVIEEDEYGHEWINAIENWSFWCVVCVGM